jgi:iron(III) transport system substrate-binding protein
MVRMGILLMALAGCSGSDVPEVVVYTSVDEPFAEPLFLKFREKTGIEVRPLFDSEAAKTVGLARRIVSERRSPRCDVFWSNEVLLTLLLVREGLLEPYVSPEAGEVDPEFRDPASHYTPLGGRLRVLLVRPEALGGRPEPRTVQALGDPRYRGMAAIAKPVAGTSLTHGASLCASLGSEGLRGFFEAVASNGAKVVAGNSIAKDLVVEGEAAFCLTDSDDAAKGMQEDRRLSMVIPDQDEGAQGAVLIPGTVALVKGAPHRDAARMLIDFLLSREAEDILLRSGAYQVSLRKTGGGPAALSLGSIRRARVDWRSVLAHLAEAEKIAADRFVR